MGRTGEKSADCDRKELCAQWSACLLYTSGHAYGTLLGKEAIGDKFILPLQDQLDTYVRTMESQTITSLSEKTTEAILKYNK